MKDKLKLGSTVYYKQGSFFDVKPKFVLKDLKIYLTPYSSYNELEKSKAALIGTDPWLWESGDSLLFDKEEKTLKYACFIMPEKNKIPPSISSLEIVKGETGLLTLNNGLTPNEIPSMSYRHYSIEHNFLFCFNDDFVESQKNYEEVVIANDVSIIFNDSEYCGWKLKNPELYLLNNLSSDLPDMGQTSIFVKNCFSEALDIIEDDNIDQMNDANTTPLKRLHSLYQKIKSSEFSRNKNLIVISEWLFDVAERFYSEDKMQMLNW